MLDNIKRLTKLIISIGFFLCGAVGNTIRWLVGRKPPATCVVFHYHAVAPEYRAQFARQMDALLRWTIPIAADNHQPLRPGKRFAAVTFDDGFLCVLENALPELMRRRIPATIFIPAGLLGTTPEWLTFGEDYIADQRIALLEELKDLPTDSMTIGSHTLSHAWLPSLPEAEAKIELSVSRNKLKKLLNRDINLFSFPYGAVNEHLIELCREAGYERVFTTLPTLAFADPYEFVTGRIVVEPTDWPLEFLLKLLGAYRWLAWVIVWKRKVLSSRSPESISNPELKMKKTALTPDELA